MVNVLYRSGVAVLLALLDAHRMEDLLHTVGVHSSEGEITHKKMCASEEALLQPPGVVAGALPNLAPWEYMSLVNDAGEMEDIRARSYEAG